MTIISLANSMFASKHAQHLKDDRLDAARALLGVSPSSVADSSETFGGRVRADESTNVEVDAPRRPRSNSAGLDALAFLATKEQASMAAENDSALGHLEGNSMAVGNLSSSDDDAESMPPPPPRFVSTRRRSVSNPEGMERWVPRSQSRMHFVLPASILEEELAEASAAMKAREERYSDVSLIHTIAEEDDDEIVDQDELLRRARSRLLEDLSEGNLNGDKGVLTLPHSLAKYKDVYNKNGRIGIYTPAERAAIISRFQNKRNRRVWNKKIRYNCRKNLADRRMRVKGRFVKRATEQQARATGNNGDPSSTLLSEESTFVSPDSSVGEGLQDSEMPDISDPDAGFCPTDDQPFRRTRRHTIT